MPKKRKEMSTPQQQQQILNRPLSIGRSSSSVHNNNNTNNNTTTPVDLDDDDDNDCYTDNNIINNNNTTTNLNSSNNSNNNFSTTIHSIIQNSTVLNNTRHRNSIMISGLNISKLEEEISALDDSIMFNNSTNYDMTTTAVPTTTTPMIMSNMSFFGGGQQEQTSTVSSLPRIIPTLSSHTGSNNNMLLVPIRPRRLWTIRDTKVPTFPLFYPKPSKQTSTYIRGYPDTPPSTIAIRISECLLKRSISTDYDDEAMTATCLTIDRCLFIIHIWKVPTSKTNTTNTNTTNQLYHDKDDLLIECVRTKGNCFAFHRATRAILLAAHGLDSGKDKRNTIQSSLLEYPRFVSSAPTRTSTTTSTSTSSKNRNVINTSTGIGATNLSPRTPTKLNVSQYSSKLVDESAMMASVLSSTSFMMTPPSQTWEVLKPIHPLKLTEVIDTVQQSMDTIITMLKKDRLQPQLHGMEMLVSLTDPYCVGYDIALHSSLCILGRTSSSTSNTNTTTTKNSSNIRSSPGRVSSLISGTISEIPTSITGSPTSDDDAANVTVHCNTTSEAVAVAAAQSSSSSSSSSSSMDEIQKKWIFDVIVHRRLPTETPIDGCCTTTEVDYDTMNNNNNSFSFNNCTNSLASIENPMVVASPSTTVEVAVAVGTTTNTTTAKIPITTIPSLQQQQQKQPGTSNPVDTTTTTPMDVAGTDDTTGIDNEDHGGKIRLLALRVLVNALCNLSKYQDIVLESILSVQNPLWISDSMLNALSEDIQKGCCRPVQVVHSTRLASQHEATICCRIIRILILHNKNIKQRILQQQQNITIKSNNESSSLSKSSSSSLLQYLELARNIGKSTHTILAQEAHETYQLLTEDDRSV